MPFVKIRGEQDPRYVSEQEAQELIEKMRTINEPHHVWVKIGDWEGKLSLVQSVDFSDRDKYAVPTQEISWREVLEFERNAEPFLDEEGRLSFLGRLKVLESMQVIKWEPKPITRWVNGELVETGERLPEEEIRTSSDVIITVTAPEAYSRVLKIIELWERKREQERMRVLGEKAVLAERRERIRKLRDAMAEAMERWKSPASSTPPETREEPRKTSHTPDT